MAVSLIAAVAANGVIGDGNRLPWRLPADLRRFRSLTLGHWLVMGRKTWEGIGRPLPGRQTVVLTRQPGYAADGAHVAGSLRGALALAGGDAQVFIAGGAEVYREALTLEIGERLWLTRIHQPFFGDADFPEIDPRQWSLASAERHEASGEVPFAYSFLLYERRVEAAG
jgi:dihydrofolate reductase